MLINSIWFYQGDICWMKMISLDGVGFPLGRRINYRDCYFTSWRNSSLAQGAFAQSNAKHWIILSPFNYRLRFSRSGPEYAIMNDKPASRVRVRAMVISATLNNISVRSSHCYIFVLFINKFLYLIFYLSTL